jgi:hypothetical protein
VSGASLLQKQQRATKGATLGMVIGTAGYMSPEKRSLDMHGPVSVVP